MLYQFFSQDSKDQPDEMNASSSYQELRQKAVKDIEETNREMIEMMISKRKRWA
jgi:hypothetical protein